MSALKILQFVLGHVLLFVTIRIPTCVAAAVHSVWPYQWVLFCRITAMTLIAVHYLPACLNALISHVCRMSKGLPPGLAFTVRSVSSLGPQVTVVNCIQEKGSEPPCIDATFEGVSFTPSRRARDAAKRVELWSNGDSERAGGADDSGSYCKGHAAQRAGVEFSAESALGRALPSGPRPHCNEALSSLFEGKSALLQSELDRTDRQNSHCPEDEHGRSSDGTFTLVNQFLSGLADDDVSDYQFRINPSDGGSSESEVWEGSDSEISDVDDSDEAEVPSSSDSNLVEVEDDIEEDDIEDGVVDDDSGSEISSGSE